VRAPLYIVRLVGTSRRGWAEGEGRKERPERRNHSLRKFTHSKINININLRPRIVPEAGLAFKPSSRDASKQA
jgi:hypothetical protein